MSQRLTVEEIYRKLQNRCENSIYSFELEKVIEDYKNNTSKIRIYCEKHGEILVNFSNFAHCRHGCSKCGLDTIKLKRRKDIKTLLKSLDLRCKNTIYSYNVEEIVDEYTNCNSKLSFYCKIHGKFKMSYTTFVHANHSCARCSGQFGCVDRLNLILNKLEERCNNSPYSYESENILLTFKNSRSKIQIKCRFHGIFEPTLTNFVHNKTGCPKCKSSKGQDCIRLFMKANNIKFIEEKTFNACKDKARLKFDFYIEDYNICIEFQGLQHYEFSPHFHRTLEKFEQCKKRDEIKRKFCLENSIILIEIDGRIFNSPIAIEEKLNQNLKGLINNEL